MEKRNVKKVVNEEGLVAFGEHDLTLIVEDRKIFVSKTVLCIASPVFQAMLKSDFKERNETEIELPGKKYADFVEFLCCIYPDKLKDVSAGNVYGVLPLASEYQVKTLMKQCQKRILKIVNARYTATTEEIYRHLQLAEQFNPTDLKERCIVLASELSLADMNKGSAAYKVSDDSVLKIRYLAIQRMELYMQDDAHMFQLHMTKSIKSMIEYSNYVTVHVKDIVKHSMQTNSFDYSQKLRDARICSRLTHYESNSEFKSKLEEITSQLNGLGADRCKQYKEEIDLLPEAVKRSLTII